jgi:hypothetical protein
VSKAEYVLSVLLRLGKLDYDSDVHLWAQVCASHYFLNALNLCSAVFGYASNA